MLGLNDKNSRNFNISSFNPILMFRMNVPTFFIFNVQGVSTTVLRVYISETIDDLFKVVQIVVHSIENCNLKIEHSSKSVARNKKKKKKEGTKETEE